MPAARRAQASATPIEEDLGAREELRHSAPPRQSLFKGDAEKDKRTGKRRASLAQSQDDIDAGRPAVDGTGEVGGAADLLDPGETRFWRALPGEGDGTLVTTTTVARGEMWTARRETAAWLSRAVTT